VRAGLVQRCAADGFLAGKPWNRACARAGTTRPRLVEWTAGVDTRRPRRPQLPACARRRGERPSGCVLLSDQDGQRSLLCDRVSQRPSSRPRRRAPRHDGDDWQPDRPLRRARSRRGSGTGARGADAAPGDVSVSFASCQPGESMVGGGVSASGTAFSKASVIASAPNDVGKWAVAVRNDGAGGSTLQAYSYALCASP